MSNASSLPTLFGRVTAASAEHQHLATTLAELRDVCARRGTVGSLVQKTPETVLDQLLNELGRHFAAEEADAYFGQMVRDNPQVLCKVSDLRAEHAELLATVGRLRATASVLEAESLCREVSSLISRLRAHEQVEESVIRTYLVG